MAEGARMTVADIVANALAGARRLHRRGGDVVAREPMEAKVSVEIGAGARRSVPSERLTHRNGYRRG